MGVDTMKTLALKELAVQEMLGENSTTPISIGVSGSTSHSLATNDSLYVGGGFEVDGTAYFDGQLP